MFGLATTSRAAAAVAGVVGLAVLLPSTNEWPATDEFDGRLFANPETGCLELPPDDRNAAHVIPVEPTPALLADEVNRDGIRRRTEELRAPGWQSDARVHAEPWPACHKPPSATPAGTGTGVDR